MYDSFALIDPDSTITTAALAAELRRFHGAAPKHAPTAIRDAGEQIELVWPSFTLRITRVAAPHVVEESTEIADNAGENHPDRERIARVSCRFEISGDDDPDMIHFNDYVLAFNAIERLGKAYLFDLGSGGFQ